MRCAAACGNVGSSKCTRCKRVSYCSEACQRAHWKAHKKTCAEETSGGGGEAGAAAAAGMSPWEMAQVYMAQNPQLMGMLQRQMMGGFEDEGAGSAGSGGVGRPPPPMLKTKQAAAGTAAPAPRAPRAPVQLHAPPPPPLPHPMVHTGNRQVLSPARSLCGACSAPLHGVASARACAACRCVHYCARSCLHAHALAHADYCFAVVQARVGNGDVHVWDKAAEVMLRARVEALRGALPSEASLRTEGNTEPFCQAASVLCHLLIQLGRHKEAEEDVRTVMERRVSVLGLEHGSTLAALKLVALCLSHAGKLVAGTADHLTTLYERSLTKRQSSLGSKHPATLACAVAVAEFKRACGQTAEAVALHRATLGARREVLGARHTSTLASAASLGALLATWGVEGKASSAGLKPAVAKRVLEGVELLREAVAGLDEALGPGHPSTLAAQGQLMIALGNKGGQDCALEVKALMRSGQQAAKLTVGPRHEATLAFQTMACRALLSLGSHALCGGLLDAVVAERTLALGHGHPTTVAARQLASECKARAAPGGQ